MYTDMEQWAKIRFQVLRKGKSKREVLLETGMHWKTLEKILENPSPPGYRLDKPRDKPKLGPYLERIEQILESDKDVPRKQRHTVKRIFERISDEGYRGKYTVVKDAVREMKRVKREVFMPLVHRPGEAQVDFGHVLAKVSGQLRRLVFFVMALPHSDAFFIMVFERECTETYWEGHVRAFEFFGGIPTRITYDNAKVLVSAIIGPHSRKLTDGFLQLQSHYLFDYRFCRVARPNEKGVVEGVVKYSRLNFMVPVPEVKDLEELNVQLVEKCQSELKRRLRGKSAAKEELLREDRSAFLSLPPSPIDACKKVPTRANSMSLVRFNTNDYSVPERYAHYPIVVKGYANRIVLCHGADAIAEHPRSWAREGVFFDFRHYLPLVERKPGSLDHALPFVDLELPQCFEVLRRRLEADAGETGEGTREYIRVLCLLKDYSISRTRTAVERALRVGAHSRDAIAMFLSPKQFNKPPTFKLDGREHLKWVRVGKPSVADYSALLPSARGEP